MGETNVFSLYNNGKITSFNKSEGENKKQMFFQISSPLEIEWLLPLQEVFARPITYKCVNIHRTNT